MVRRKKKVEPEIEWEASAEWKAMQLTPEEKAAARAEVQKSIDRARREGVYERLRALVGTLKLEDWPEELREDRD